MHVIHYLKANLKYISILIAGGMFAASISTSAFAGEAVTHFGGPVYHGAPDLPVTVALVVAGGGPGHFSLVTALEHMLGKKTVNAEVGKLVKQYGKAKVDKWVAGIDYAVDDTLKITKEKSIMLPKPADLDGHQLAAKLVMLGTDRHHVFWAGLLFDHLLSHPIHHQVMVDTDKAYGSQYDSNYHAITNQAMYDVAHALGMKEVRLASLH